MPQAKLIFGTYSTFSTSFVAGLTGAFAGSTDGSLSSLTPVDESVYKRLQLLQGQLTRNIQHFAGLNPKAFRFVGNYIYPLQLLTHRVQDCSK
jgi:hypothetical protein